MSSNDGRLIGPEAVAISLVVNGAACFVQVEPGTTLVDAIRDSLGLTGTKVGCAHGQCGACTVLINGERRYSCIALAIMHDGDQIQTIEGVATEQGLHPLQRAFIEHDAFQCGFCTPGKIMSGLGLLREGHARTNDDIRELMSGNICRCAAYQHITAALREVLDSSGELESELARTEELVGTSVPA